jgi:hypothetical protein
MALEEWRHYVDRSQEPGILHTAKGLNSRQAMWALLFTWFNFSFSYRPGSNNVKPDALSRRYNPTTTTPEPETILSTLCLATVLSWQIGKQVQDAQRSQPKAGGGPDNRMFVPDAGRSSVLERAHSFWWPTMVPDVSVFVAACKVCAQNKTPLQVPAGLLQPLSFPHCPWSHISRDFIMGLPPSDGNIAILTIVDQFSIAAHFVPLPKLPSAKETAQVIVQRVFRIPWTAS